jgi:8-oxo-dGTP pyrophosphatase MutT (NUDIX family)
VARLLAEYRPQDPVEAADLVRVRRLLDRSTDAWRRDSPLHLTASALILHPAAGRVLLRWHRRQQAWLQVGGHADPGESDPFEIAVREAGEETGLTDLVACPDAALRHLVVVDVPELAGDPAHEHADLRFVLATASPEAVRPERPDAPLRWFTMSEAYQITAEDNLRETLSRLSRPA